MENRKYAKYVKEITAMEGVNHDPKSWDVWAKVHAPLIFDKRHLEETPLHVEVLMIHGAGTGFGAGHPAAESVLSDGRKFVDLPMSHDHPEIFVFAGTNPEDPHDLGGEDGVLPANTSKTHLVTAARAS